MKKFFFVISFIAVIFVLSGCDWFEKDTTGTTKGTTATTVTTHTTHTTATTSTTSTTATVPTETTTTNPPVGNRYLTYNLGTDSQTWDPSYNSASDGGHIVMNMFEGIFRATETGQELAGATDYDVSEDLKTYTFYLREDAKWSNGQPVTSADYRFAWLRVINHDKPSDYSYIMSPYIVNGDCYMKGECTADQVGILTPDPYTLVVNLNFPIPYFLQLLSFYTYMPVYSGNGELADGWEKTATTAVSNGPFKFSEYRISDYVLLVRNEYYWNKDNVKIDGVKFLIIKDATTALAAYRLGEIDVLDAFAPADIATLLSEDPYFRLAADVGTYYYNFNMDDELIGDPAGENGLKVRKALSMAIDRQAIIDNVTKGYQLPAIAFTPSILTYSDGSACGQDIYGIEETAQVEAAQALLVEAGYDTPEKLAALGQHILLGYNQVDTDGHKLIAQAIQQMWKTNLGIEVRLEQQEWQIFQESRQQGVYTIARAGWLGDYPDPNTMLDLFTSYSGMNDSQWRWQNSDAYSWDTYVNPSNQAYDEAIEAAMVSSGTVRDGYLKAAEQVLLDNYVVLPLYWYSRMDVINYDNVDGVVRTQMGHWYFGNAEFVE